MKAVTADEIASVEPVLQTYFRPGAHERAVKILKEAQERREGRNECAAIAQRISSLLREREANGKALRAVI
jgi:hypothetical protein